MNSPPTHSVLLVIAVLLSLSSILPLSFALDFGQSQTMVQRTWVMHNNGDEMSFNGSLAVNNSNQHVISVEVSPEATYSVDKNGVLWVRYSGKVTGNVVVTGRALVETHYETNLISDPPSSQQPPSNSQSSQTNYTTEMAAKAQSLKNPNSSLQTITNVLNWVHSAMTYDLSYWGKAKSAEAAFKERHGVCVEYTHLFLSLIRSLGFEARYVTGYVISSGWQPHAWAEVNVPGYGWLPADPTFGQIGILDNSHVAMAYGLDQASVYDSLYSYDPEASLKNSDNLSIVSSANEPGVVDISLAFDNETYIVETNLTNTANQYVFGSYVFVPPQGNGETDYEVILLNPSSTVTRHHDFNGKNFKPGFMYTMPVTVSFNGLVRHETFKIAKTEASDGLPDFNLPSDSKQPLACQSSAFLALLVLASMLVVKPANP